MMTRSLIVEADGGSRGNPGPAAYGTVVRDGATGAVLAEIAEFIGETTNNVAEYRGAIAGLQRAHELDASAVVEVRLDSKLVVEQMSGRWQIKHPDMRELAKAARAVFAPGQVTYRWVPRKENAAADALVNEVLDAAINGGTHRIDRGGAQLSPDLNAQDVVGEADVQHTRDVIERARPANRMIGWTDLGAPVTTLAVRHGATQFSLDKRFSGRGGQDVPLSAIGQHQAEAVAHELAARGGGDIIVASPLLRTRQTAMAIAREVGVDIELEEGLAECAFGEWDGLTFTQVQERWPDLVDEWLASTDVAPPGGESFAECRNRVEKARQKVVDKYPGQRVIVVSHVTPIKVLVSTAVDAPLSSLYRMELMPCSITTLSWFPDGNSSMFGFSEAAHLRNIPVPEGT